MNRNEYFNQLFNNWQASDLPLEEFMHQQKLESIRNIFNGTASPKSGTKQAPHGTPPKWKNLDEMMAYMRAHPPGSTPPNPLRQAAQAHKPKPDPKKSPEYRRREIEYELDVIRGRVPTPKGYKIDPGKVKELVAELKQLS